jgi:hypothetical protein
VTDDPGWASPALLQRAVHLAALRILVDERRSELERIAEETERVAVAGFAADPGDAAVRVALGRSRQRLARRGREAEQELRAAEAALRAAVLDDAWTPADDLGGPATG